MALGRFAEEEYKPNLHKLGQQIKGQRGLLFSNKPVEEVLRYAMYFLLHPFLIFSFLIVFYRVIEIMFLK